MATKELEKEKTEASKQLHDPKLSKQEKNGAGKTPNANRAKRKPLL
ncbi:hypothetical protein [Mucilaginibacter celer]|nr:hypothetical protein [Mucilaginibacter celer]